LGDASSGGDETLSLFADGTYRREFVGKAQNTPLMFTDLGFWSMTDSVLTLTPQERDGGTGPLTASRYRVHGVIQGRSGVELLMSGVESTRLPVDSGGYGDIFDVATGGSAVLRYLAR